MSLEQIKAKLKSPVVWGNLLAMFVVVITLCIAVILWLDSYTQHGDDIIMPDLYGVTFERAQQQMNEKGITLVVNGTGCNKKMPDGCVLLQQPEKNMKVKRGRLVYVTVNSLKMPLLVIPDLIDNSSYREAQAKLQAIGFKVLEPKLIDGEKDWVYGIQYNGRNLTAADSVPKESQLTLVIGNGSVGSDDDLGSMNDWGENDSTAESGSAQKPDEVDDFLEVFE